MNLPVRGFVERLLVMKLKWASLEGIVPVAAIVKNGTPNPSPEDVLELNLTPHELGWEPNTFCWVWLQKAGKHDSPQRSTKAIYKDRLKAFYQYYRPEKVHEAESILTDFDGAEELLFAKLVGQYGPEPTAGQLRRKAVADEDRGVRPDYSSKPSEIANVIRDMQIQYLKDTGQYTDTRPSGAVPERYKDLIMSAKPAAGGRASVRGSDGEFTGISRPLQESLTSALMHQSDTLLRFSYYRKLLMFRSRRQEMRKIIGLMKGNAFNSTRKDYYNKWKTIVITKKMRRQVQQSTEMAAKSESLVGDLATENTFLKSEMQRLRSQVEMLDNANSKRLESLYNSSELAIGQIRILSAENQQKEELINKLEQRLLSIGNMMLQANDERDRTLEMSAAQKLELERENATFKTKILLLEDSLKAATEEIEKLRPLPKPASCTHCPHYFELQCDIEVLHANGNQLRARLEDSEHERRKQQENIRSLMTQINNLRDGGASPQQIHRRHSFEESDSDGQQDRATPPPPPPPDTDSEEDRGVTPPPPPASSTAGQQRQAPYAPLNFSMSSLPPNPSFGIAPQRGPPPPASRSHDNGGGALAADNHSGTKAAGGGTAPFYGYDPHQVQPVQLSMHTFFEREAACAREKAQLAMSRQLQPRLRSSGFATAHATLSADVTQRIAEQKRQYLDGLNSSAASLPSSHQVQRVKDAGDDRAVGEFGRRPIAAPDHSRYEVGKPADPAEMRRSIFAYKRL
jgi:hypothetical protein